MIDVNKQDDGSMQVTRKALIDAGMRLFGRQGFEATSIRQIAAEANTNSASIAYHFGSKDGLRRACGEAAAGRLIDAIGPALSHAGDDPDAETAARALENTARAMAHFLLTRPEAEDIAPFMLREVNAPGEVLEGIYNAIFLPVHKRACRMWAAATDGDPESAETRLEVFALVGQILYFRIGREIVVRRMEWTTIGAQEARSIGDVVSGNIRAAIAAKRSGRR